MNTSPITKWDGAQAYFTYADNPTMIYALLALSAVIVVAAIIYGSFHEKECYMKVESNGKH